ncbi:GNAT family N-acetyltransferase [Staphylococcus carnosus]|uniref:Acetyltransferase n=2 Tax=Staphylococcus carnosus TaxID=1281 RepID=B9DPR9_STACT|nr:GNAT family N-acetyltransferase [Staphylococcus carnosus]ANZ33634.1 GCN5 family acetyltransferase [Staphylococcus carnosus]KKB24434.1 GCN5 family acetyltransferase [Staphylococcus carnosus]QPT03851.1 GNAT family N-acetyltransferase [Staphylococcus carnosus]QQS85561.1 GNAT family N-acetyltransferase [Staphylococcus carnosus]QRQ05500.1 GNAT family N-acetyltransferase [Staphylococcus carnosus]
MDNIEVIVKKTQDLSPEELVQIMIERVKVFVVEQNCPYQEIDEEDFNAEHVILKKDDQIAAYARLIKTDEDFRIGRVIVVKAYRKNKLGYQLMNTAIEELRKIDAKRPIKISAQEHLLKFYGSFGFERTSETYLEDGIPHVDMVLEAD